MNAILLLAKETYRISDNVCVCVLQFADQQNSTWDVLLILRIFFQVIVS